jgi:hypothetical protein
MPALVYPPYPPNGMLTPTYGFGSGARTLGFNILGSPRSSIGSQARVYNYIKARGGPGAVQEYERNLILYIWGGNSNPYPYKR